MKGYAYLLKGIVSKTSVQMLGRKSENEGLPLQVPDAQSEAGYDLPLLQRPVQPSSRCH